MLDLKKTNAQQFNINYKRRSVKGPQGISSLIGCCVCYTSCVTSVAAVPLRYVCYIRCVGWKTRLMCKSWAMFSHLVVLLRLSKPVPKPRFFAKPNRTETAVLCLSIDGSVLKWSSSGVLNVNSRLQSSRPLISLVGVIVGIKGEIAGGGGHARRVCA